jgi:hypothetical protein
MCKKRNYKYRLLKKGQVSKKQFGGKIREADDKKSYGIAILGYPITLSYPR